MAATAPTIDGVVELFVRRRDAAQQWRLDHADDPERDRSWRAFRTGALWNVRLQRHEIRRAVAAALRDAERQVSYGVCDVLVDIGRRCGQPTPCPQHPTS